MRRFALGKLDLHGEPNLSTGENTHRDDIVAGWFGVASVGSGLGKGGIGGGSTLGESPSPKSAGGSS